MKKALSPLVALVVFLLSGSAWSQNDQKLVIEPEFPDSEVWLDEAPMQIRLTFFSQQCQNTDPNKPDFETTIGPLDVGDYTVVYSQFLEAFLPRLADKIEFSVVQAQPVSSLTDGEIVESEAEHWGRLEVDMTSCLEGSVAFYSDLPEFGNGEFPIERLAFVKQLDCTGND